MSDLLDVLIIGGFSLSDSSGGGSKTRDRIRLSHKNHYAGTDFIKHLVQSNASLEIAERRYADINKSRLVSRSLNTIYLFDYLIKKGFQTKAVNYFLLEQKKFEELISFKPEVVVISTTFISNASEVNIIAKTVKELSPKSTVVVGGMKILKSFKKFTLYNQGYFDGFDVKPMISDNFFFDYESDKYIDVFVIEECGEVTLLELIRKIKNGYDWKTTPNIAYYEKGNLVFTKKVKEPYTFEQNLISWDKIPEDILGNEIPVMAGMGCPFKCTFCDFTDLHTKVRSRSMDGLITELKLIQNTFPGKSIFFTDDNLFTTKKRTKQLCEAIVQNGLSFKWRGFFRADAISQENVDIIAKSGCSVGLLGVESGDNEILRNMKKRETREQTLKAVNLLNENGISTISTFMVGFPGETEESVNRTISLLNSYPDNNRTLNKYYPLVFLLCPLSPIASPENRMKYGIKGSYERWSHNTMNSEEAKEHFARCFQEINRPTVSYLEYIDPDIPFSNLKDIFKARNNLVKSGINVIEESNVSLVYQAFKKILSH